jgi:signal transduction histidine kinase
LSGYVALQIIRRAPELAFGINDYAQRLTHAQSENARIEDSLLTARKLEEWSRMSAVVTHEINNPLSAIQNFMFLIQNSPSTPADVKAMAQQAEQEVLRIGTIARSTLGFFRQEEQPESIDIGVSADSVQSLLQPLLRQRDIRLVIECTGDTTVNAYPMETRQVLLNLVRNACEATIARGAEVNVRIQGRAHDVMIVVEDQGTGIAPEMLPNLFQFGITTKGESGNGIGLWVVKKMVTRRGGTVEVESTPGKGSRFTVLWPRQSANESAAPSPVNAMAVASL